MREDLTKYEQYRQKYMSDPLTISTLAGMNLKDEGRLETPEKNEKVRKLWEKYFEPYKEEEQGYKMPKIKHTKQIKQIESDINEGKTVEYTNPY